MSYIDFSPDSITKNIVKYNSLHAGTSFLASRKYKSYVFPYTGRPIYSSVTVIDGKLLNYDEHNRVVTLDYEILFTGVVAFRLVSQSNACMCIYNTRDKKITIQLVDLKSASVISQMEVNPDYDNSYTNGNVVSFNKQKAVYHFHHTSFHLYFDGKCEIRPCGRYAGTDVGYIISNGAEFIVICTGHMSWRFSLGYYCDYIYLLTPDLVLLIDDTYGIRYINRDKKITTLFPKSSKYYYTMDMSYPEPNGFMTLFIHNEGLTKQYSIQPDSKRAELIISELPNPYIRFSDLYAVNNHHGMYSIKEFDTGDTILTIDSLIDISDCCINILPKSKDEIQAIANFIHEIIMCDNFNWPMNLTKVVAEYL